MSLKCIIGCIIFNWYYYVNLRLFFPNDKGGIRVICNFFSCLIMLIFKLFNYVILAVICKIIFIYNPPLHFFLTWGILLPFFYPFLILTPFVNPKY